MVVLGSVFGCVVTLCDGLGGWEDFVLWGVGVWVVACCGVVDLVAS